MHDCLYNFFLSCFSANHSSCPACNLSYCSIVPPNNTTNLIAVSGLTIDQQFINLDTDGLVICNLFAASVTVKLFRSSKSFTVYLGLKCRNF